MERCELPWNYLTYFSLSLENEFKMIVCEAYIEGIISKILTTIPQAPLLHHTNQVHNAIYLCIEIKKARCTITKKTQKTQRQVEFQKAYSV